MGVLCKKLNMGFIMNKKILVALAAVIILGLLAAGGIILYEKIAEKYKESEVKMELSAYYNVPDGEAMLIIDEKVREKNVLFLSGEPYLDLPTVKEMYTAMFTWNPDEQRMYYTTPSTEYVIIPDSTDMLVDGKTVSTTVPTMILREDVPHIAMSFLLNCSNITYRVYENPARVLVTYSTDEILCVKVKEESSIRVSQDIKSDYLEKIPAGSVLRIIEGGGIQQKGFIKVMSQDGVRGYILEEKLDYANRYNESPSFNSYEPETVKHKFEKGKVYLSWQLTYSSDCVDEMLENITQNPEINVVAPTWFFMKGTDGSIISYASKDYVKAAHERDVKVWALLKNDDIEGKFNCIEDSHTVLASYEARKKLIKNVVDEINSCGADGLNVDIESLKVETGVFFIQFIRELSIACRKNGITLSVDNIIPEEYNAFYNIPEQAKVVDYVILMAYDEHYLGSEAGSVASLLWVNSAVEKSLKKCPKEQLVLALPFFTRLWKVVEKNDEKTYTSKLLNLREAESLIEEKDPEKSWKKDLGQFYIRYEGEDFETYYCMWHEDRKSLMLKSLIAREQDLGGLAAWKMGDEFEGLWTVLKACVEGEIPIDDTEQPAESIDDTDDDETEADQNGDIAP